MKSTLPMSNCAGLDGDTGLSMGPPSRATWLWLAALMAAGTVLRVLGMDSDLWLDEVGTVITYLRLPVQEVVRKYNSANQHLLYSVLGSLSFQVFGESAWSARLPAVLFGIGGIAGLFYMARAVASDLEALLTAALLTFSYHHVWFSQDARGYSAMVFWSLWGTGFFLRALESNHSRHWIAWTLSMAAGICSLNNTAFVFFGHIAAWAFLVSRYQTVTRRIFAASFCVVVLSLLAHSFVLTQMIRFFRSEERTGLGWYSLREFAPVVYNGLLYGIGAAGAAIFLVLMSAGWLSFWRRQRVAGLVFLIAPLLNLEALVVLHYGAYPRSFLYMLPFAILIAVRGAMLTGDWVSRRGLRRPRLGVVLILIVLAGSGTLLIKNYRYPKQDYRSALAYANENKTHGDMLVAVGLAGSVYQRYYAPAMVVPASREELAALRAQGHAIWLLYSFPRDMKLRFPEIYRYIQTDFKLVRTFPGTLGDGYLYVVRAEGLTH